MVWERLSWCVRMLVVFRYFAGGIKVRATTCAVEKIYVIMSSYIINY